MGFTFVTMPISPNARRLVAPILVATVCLFATPELIAQPWLRTPMMSTKPLPETKSSLERVRARFESHWEDKKPSLREEENREEGGYQQFKRWEWLMKTRSYPTGKIQDPEALFKESRNYRTAHPVDRALRTSSPWQFIGPSVIPSSGGGVGRINVMRVQPGNNSILYVGTASGGVWKSTDGGATWNSSFDFVSSISVADIAINPRNPDTVYAATGDGYGYEVGGDFWGGLYSAGVLMSTDGGNTWQSTGLTYAQTNSEIIQRLVIKPDEPEVLLASTRNNLFRSTNGGQTWTSVRSGHHFDIEFHPTRPDTVFASDVSRLLMSINGGASWTVMQSSLCNGRISLALSAANVNRIFILCEDGELYRSDDLGVTIQTMTPPTDASFYGYYDAVLAVSPTNASTVVCGGFAMARSLDGGTTWNQIGGSVHADQHYLEYQPGNGQILYSCNDGGIYKSTNGGGSWTNISQGLGIKQYYRFAQSSADPYTLYAGAQDNGTDRLLSGSWTQVYGGDGMDCMVDYLNDQNVYVSYQYGALQKSTDGGQSFNDISPSSGDWVTPFAMHPTQPDIIYAGYDAVYRSDDAGLTWNTISPSNFGDNLIALAVAPSNPDHIYAASINTIEHTSNNGSAWSTITAGLPAGNVAITGIAVSDANPLRAWVTFSGYSNGEKVFATSDGGATWSNISGSLPNLPVNCIVYQSGSPGSVYVGTDMGVFYRDSTLNDWVAYSSALPQVIVSDLDIHYGIGKLRAATYGRGLWECDLQSFTAPTLDAAIVQVQAPVGTYCVNPLVPQIEIRNNGTDTLTQVSIETFVDNASFGTYLWTGQLPGGQQQLVSLPAITVYPGQRTARFVLSLPNGSADQNTLNDSKSSTFVMLNQPVSMPLTEDFESQQLPPNSWNLEGANALFQLNTNVGGFMQSPTSTFANCFDISSATARLLTPVFDLSTATGPVEVAFDLAYATYSASYHDSLIVSYSTDCGGTFTRIYAKGDDSLATAPTTTSKFEPSTASDWRRELISVNGLSGQSQVIFAFEVISGYGNDIYLDNINVEEVPLQSGMNETEVFALRVFPNPVNDELRLTMPAINGGRFTVEWVDALGRVLRSEYVRGEGTVVVDASGLPAGFYQIRLIEQGKCVGRAKVLHR